MKPLLPLSLFLIIACASTAVAGEFANSRLNDLKLNCDTCHGVGGHSPTPDQVPSLAGKGQKTLISQFKAFREGRRKHQTMIFLTNSMTDEEMKQIARYYSRGGK